MIKQRPGSLWLQRKFCVQQLMYKWYPIYKRWMAFQKPPSCKFLSAQSSGKDSTSSYGHTAPGSWCGDLFSFRFSYHCWGACPPCFILGMALAFLCLLWEGWLPTCSSKVTFSLAFWAIPPTFWTLQHSV